MMFIMYNGKMQELSVEKASGLRGDGKGHSLRSKRTTKIETIDRFKIAFTANGNCEIPVYVLFFEKNEYIDENSVN